MPSVDVVDLNNAVVGSLELADEVFGAPVNEELLYEAVRHSQAARRGGNAKTKTRHEVSGSGKKLWKQKGTGRARMGSIRSPLWRHGGTTHGPQPRDYSYKLPRKMLLGALRIGAVGQAAGRRAESGAANLRSPITRPRRCARCWTCWTRPRPCCWWITAKIATWR